MLSDRQKEYKELLVKQIQALASDLNDMAPDLVGDSGGITNFEIHLKFPPDGFVPTIELVREHIGNRLLVWCEIENRRSYICLEKHHMKT